MYVYVEWDLAAPEEEELRRRLKGHDVWIKAGGPATEKDRAAFLGAEVALGPVAPAWLAETRQLSWLQLASVGFDSYLPLDWDKLGQRIRVTNLRGVMAEAVAETCLAGILALYRGIDRVVAWQPQRAWRKMELRPALRLLQDSAILIAGDGSMGRRLRELLVPFGGERAVFARTSPQATVRTLDELDAWLPKADLVCAILPETPQTRLIFDAARLAKFKPGAVFVNAGRGSVVDEAALVAALREGRFGGAVLDVTQVEPLPPDHPLWQCPNTILTQHTAGGSCDETRRIIAFFADNFIRYTKGLPLQNVVEWSRGY